MNKFLRISSIGILLFSAILIVKAEGISPRGSNATQITFPIAELGSCGSKQECKTYCDKPENISACSAFAQGHGLITQEEKQRADKLSQVLASGPGPGECTDAASCKSYCGDPSHADICAAFAQAHDLLPKQNIDTAKKLGKILQNGGGPGACKNEGECKAFCSQQENQKVCQDFAKKNGLIKPEDSSKLDKFNQLVKDGQTPGGCNTKDTCESYCKDESHKQECLDFVVKLGGISRDTAEKIKQTGTTGPGGCSNKQECESYCKDESHQQECLDFAKAHGLNIKNPPTSPKTGSGGNPKECLVKLLGADVVAKLDTKNLTDEQKAAVSKCQKPSTGPPPGSLTACLIKVLGQDGVKNLDTKNLTEEQKAAIAKCRPQNGDGQHGDKNSNNPTPPGQHGDTSKIKDCLLAKLGEDGIKKMADPAQRNSPEIQQAMKDCGYPPPPGQPKPLEGQGSTNNPPPPGPGPGNGGGQNYQGNNQNPPPPASYQYKQPEVKGASTQASWWQRFVYWVTGK